MFSPLYLDNFISATRTTPQVGKKRTAREDPEASSFRRAGDAPWAALAGCIMPPNLLGHTTSGLHVRQAAVVGVASSQDPFHEL